MIGVKIEILICVSRFAVHGIFGRSVPLICTHVSTEASLSSGACSIANQMSGPLVEHTIWKTRHPLIETNTVADLGKKIGPLAQSVPYIGWY